MLGTSCLLDLLGVDLLERRALLVARDLPLGRVRRRHREVRRRAELLGDRQHPLDQLARARARAGRTSPRREVDQLAGQAVADRAPEVLLDQPARVVGQRLALVDRARDPRGRARTRSAASERASPRSGCASQMRISTVG